MSLMDLFLTSSYNKKLLYACHIKISFYSYRIVLIFNNKICARDSYIMRLENILMEQESTGKNFDHKFTVLSVNPTKSQRSPALSLLTAIPRSPSDLLHLRY